MKIALVAVVAVLAASGSALAAAPSIHVSPGTVHAGQRVQLSGNAGACPAGDRVTLLSAAFSHRHEFAGVPAVYARVRSDGSYGHSVLIPGARRPGRYSVTARCGGGNFPVSGHVRVLSP